MKRTFKGADIEIDLTLKHWNECICFKYVYLFFLNELTLPSQYNPSPQRKLSIALSTAYSKLGIIVNSQAL